MWLETAYSQRSRTVFRSIPNSIPERCAYVYNYLYSIDLIVYQKCLCVKRSTSRSTIAFSSSSSSYANKAPYDITSSGGSTRVTISKCFLSCMFKLIKIEAGAIHIYNDSYSSTEKGNNIKSVIERYFSSTFLSPTEIL